MNLLKCSFSLVLAAAVCAGNASALTPPPPLPAADHGLTVASWNLGWHLSVAESEKWIAACSRRYVFDVRKKAWAGYTGPLTKMIGATERGNAPDAVATKGQTKTYAYDRPNVGWELDWRPRDETIRLPFSIGTMPPCNVYADEDRNVVRASPELLAQRNERLAKVLKERVNADIIAFQEVSGKAAITEALGALAAQYEACSFEGYGVQRLGFAWRKTLGVTSAKCEVYDPLSLPDSGTDRRPRPGLALTFKFKDKALAFMNVHLKAACVSPLENSPDGRGKLEGEQKDCLMLQQQVAPLEAWLEQTAKSADHFVLIGDLNRDLWHEVEAMKNSENHAARVDASDPKTAITAATKVRYLLAEINDGEPPASRLTLAALSCTVSEIAARLCETAKVKRLRTEDRLALVKELGCRNPNGLDQMLISRNWPGLNALPQSKKVSIVPFGDTINDEDAAKRPAQLAASDHCPILMLLPPL